MEKITYTLELRGRLTAVGPGVHELELRAADGAALRSLVTFADEHAYAERGTIEFANGRLRFETDATGRLVDSPDPALRQGAAISEVAGGDGRFEGARGRITSNFVVGDDGAVVSNQVGVLFVERRREGGRR